MRRKTVFTVGLTTALALFVCFAASADERTAAVETLLKSRINHVLEILSRADLNDEAKREEVMAVINPVINFSLMAKLTLGKANWGRLTPDERNRFVDLFVKQLKASYLNKVTLYTDQKVIYQKAVESSGKVHVPTYLEAQDGRIEIIYKFYSANDQWQVYDVEIDGVSFIKSYRSQFDEVLNNGTVDDLFTQLAKTGEKGPSEPAAGE